MLTGSCRFKKTLSSTLSIFGVPSVASLDLSHALHKEMKNFSI
jgi:hypothetical protein